MFNLVIRTEGINITILYGKSYIIFKNTKVLSINIYIEFFLDNIAKKYDINKPIKINPIMTSV